MGRRTAVLVLVVIVGLGVGRGASADDGQKKCPSDSVAVGPACLDKYEASVWETTNAGLIKKIKKG